MGSLRNRVCCSSNGIPRNTSAATAGSTFWSIAIARSQLPRESVARSLSTVGGFINSLYRGPVLMLRGADPLVRGRRPRRPARGLRQADLLDRQRGVPRGPGGPPHEAWSVGSAYWLFAPSGFAALGKRVLPQLQVQPDGGNPHRATRLVVGGVRNVLQIEAREEARDQPRAVVALRDVLRRVLQAAISDQKIVASARQVERMDAGDSRGREFRSHRVERTMPTLPGDRDSPSGHAIDGRECEAFRLSVIPPEPGEDADVLGQLLLQIQPESIFERAVAAGIRNHRRSAVPFRLPDGLGIGACIGAILIVQHPDRARVLAHFVAVFALEYVAAIPK